MYNPMSQFGVHGSGTNPGAVRPQPGPFVSSPFGPITGIGGTSTRASAAGAMHSPWTVDPNVAGSISAAQRGPNQAIQHMFIPKYGDPTGGVRPGVYNGPNAVEAAGGSYVPPNMQGRSPMNPHNAALAAYPGA